MSHVADSPKTAFSTPFRGVLPPSGQQISAESGMGYPLLGTRETWVVPTVPLATVFPSHAPRSTLPTPRSTPRAVTSGVKSCAQTLPPCLPPATDRRIAKDTTRPNYADWSSSFSMSPDGRFLRTNQTVLPHSPPPNR